MSDMIPLTEPITAINPETGNPCTIVGVDARHTAPRLIIINRDTCGVSAEIVDYVDNEEPRAAT